MAENHVLIHFEATDWTHSSPGALPNKGFALWPFQCTQTTRKSVMSAAGSLWKAGPVKKLNSGCRHPSDWSLVSSNQTMASFKRTLVFSQRRWVCDTFKPDYSKKERKRKVPSKITIFSTNTYFRVFLSFCVFFFCTCRFSLELCLQRAA